MKQSGGDDRRVTAESPLPSRMIPKNAVAIPVVCEQEHDRALHFCRPGAYANTIAEWPVGPFEARGPLGGEGVRSSTVVHAPSGSDTM